MSLRIYEEQKKYLHETRPYNYLPDDIVYRLPWNMGIPEPPLRVLYPFLVKRLDGTEVIDPLTIYVGRTASKQPFAYNPRYVVNPLLMIVGTPGAGKSVHPLTEVLVVRNNNLVEIPIKEVRKSDLVFSIDSKGYIHLSPVVTVMRHYYEGTLLRIRYISPYGLGKVIVTPDHSLLKYDITREEPVVPVRGDEIKVGDDMPVFSFIPNPDTATVTSVEEMKYKGYVYDIETVYGTFMLSDGLFVHNSATVKTFIYNFLQNSVFVQRKMPPVIVVDPEGEYHIIGKALGEEDMLHLVLGRTDYINIFDRPTKVINPYSWYMRMMAVIQNFLNLSPGQATQAYRVLKEAVIEVTKKKGLTFDPMTWYKSDITLEEIYNWIVNRMESLEQQKKLKEGEKRFLSGATTVMQRLDQWMQPPNDAFSHKSTVDLSKLLNYKLVILNTRELPKDLRSVFNYWIVYWAYGLMLEKGPLPEFGVRMLLIIDEAWSLLRKSKKNEENPLEALARRGRKYGILIIIATQTPEDVDEKMFSLFGTLVTGIIPSEKMVNKIVESRGMPKRFKAIIKSLGRGYLVWSINWANKNFPMSRVPILVKTDYPIKKMIQVT